MVVAAAPLSPPWTAAAHAAPRRVPCVLAGNASRQSPSDLRTRNVAPRSNPHRRPGLSDKCDAARPPVNQREDLLFPKPLQEKLLYCVPYLFCFTFYLAERGKSASAFDHRFQNTLAIRIPRLNRARSSRSSRSTFQKSPARECCFLKRTYPERLSPD